jgi:probable F420-dependent oxidoreductase
MSLVRTQATGKIGISSLELRFCDPSLAGEAIAELEELGFEAVWIPGGLDGNVLADVGRLLDTTKHVTIATGILNIYKHEPAAVAAWWHSRSNSDHARVVLGLGVSHGPLIGEAYCSPLSAMAEFLDGLDSAALPPAKRCLAALGPKMLELARHRTAGSHPYLVNPEHTALAHRILGPQALLAPVQAVILETDPSKARDMARAALVHLLRLPNYRNNWRRLGFSEEDLTKVTDHLIDGLFAWGTLEQIAARVREHLAAGASQVCLQVIQSQAATMRPPREAWRALASILPTSAIHRSSV